MSLRISHILPIHARDGIPSIHVLHVLQVEDIALCEAVQLGLEEPSYGVGRYAPGPERPMFQFHQQLYAAVMEGAGK
jgi:hypothetical protein